MNLENIGDKLTMMVIFMPFFMLSIAAHEFGHAWAAYRAGDPTAKYMGRLTLNPMMHLDPFGVLFFVISSMVGYGFGWAKPVPVNPLLFKHPRVDNIKVSIAGVSANFMLVIVAIIITKILMLIGIFSMGNQVAHWIFRICEMMIILNSILIVFNLIPIPPLDGSHVLMELLPPEMARSYARIEPYGMMIILMLLMTGVLSYILTPFLSIILFFANLIFAL